MTKVCTKCQIEKPAEAFANDRRLISGLSSRCKLCLREVWSQDQAEWRDQNRTAIRAKAKERREKLKTVLKEWPTEGSKTCNKCHQLKSFKDFGLHPENLTDGRRGRCKECEKERRNLARKNNPEKQREIARRYRQKNPERVRQAMVDWQAKNKERVVLNGKEYRQKNLEKVRASEKIKHQRRMQDPVYRMQKNLRRRLGLAVRYAGTKKFGRTFHLVGCTIEELRAHLEKQFTPGMSWDNYGKWHVDHVRPVKAHDLTTKEGQEACFHFSNLQPLWEADNLRKSAKILVPA